MNPKTSTRAEAILRALLVDEHTSERMKLAESGVSQRRIEILYPCDLSAVTGGLHAYMHSGKRIVLNQTSEIQMPIADQSLALYQLLTNAQIAAASSNFSDWQRPISHAVNAIVAYPGTVFKKYARDDLFSLTPRSQASDLVTRLLWGVTHVRDLKIPAADDYLEVVVDTCLPDLLNEI